MRADESGGVVGEVECAGLTVDDGTFRIVAIAAVQSIPVCDIIVGNHERHGHVHLLHVSEHYVGLVSNVVGRGCLCPRHGVRAVHLALVCRLDGQSLCVVTDIGAQTKG